MKYSMCSCLYFSAIINCIQTDMPRWSKHRMAAPWWYLSRLKLPPIPSSIHSQTKINIAHLLSSGSCFPSFHSSLERKIVSFPRWAEAIEPCARLSGPAKVMDVVDIRLYFLSWKNDIYLPALRALIGWGGSCCADVSGDIWRYPDWIKQRAHVRS